MKPAATVAATFHGNADDDADADDDDDNADDADDDYDDDDVAELQFQEPQHNAKCQQQAERRGKLSAKGNRSNIATATAAAVEAAAATAKRFFSSQTESKLNLHNKTRAASTEVKSPFPRSVVNKEAATAATAAI